MTPNYKSPQQETGHSSYSYLPWNVSHGATNPSLSEAAIKSSSDMRGYATSDAQTTSPITTSSTHRNMRTHQTLWRGPDHRARLRPWLGIAQFRPDLLNGIATMPVLQHLEMSLIDMLNKHWRRLPLHLLPKPGDAEKELEADPINTMQKSYGSPREI